MKHEHFYNFICHFNGLVIVSVTVTGVAELVKYCREEKMFVVLLRSLVDEGRRE